MFGRKEGAPGVSPSPHFRGAVRRTPTRWLCAAVAAASGFAPAAFAQRAYTWQELRDRLVAQNPTLQAAQLNVNESRAQEVTAHLRPNPEFTLLADGTQLLPHLGVWQPFTGTMEQTSFSYLHERAHKRELRTQSAEEGTAIAVSQVADQQRTLVYNLRAAFVQTLQAKAVLELARDNLAYYDRVLSVSTDRFKAGDIARVDLERLELQRVQYETDVQTGIVNLRTAKIQLLTLLNDRAPVDQFDVAGAFEYKEQVLLLPELRQMALATRPDLRAATQNVELARVNHQLAIANGSTDPTFSPWYTHNPSFNNPYDFNTVGGSVTIPLRIFDRNQGEKARTLVEIDRNQRLRDAAAAQVLSDVDSAYTTINSNLELLRRYKSTYLDEAARVRDTISFSYQQGGASLLDFLNAQSDYRSVQLAYLNLVGSWMSAANQLNLAVGTEVIQ